MAKLLDQGGSLQDYLHSNDYYVENERVEGRWMGRGSERLGLRGSIKAGNQAFESLRKNINPATGQKLTPRSPTVRFFDLQCSAQKSVSLMAVLMDDRRLAAAHDAACETAYAELERFAACRVRDGSLAWSEETRITGNLIAARFRHDSSRALDPQLHSHCVTANATWDSVKGRWVALSEYEILKAIRYSGKVYQNEMARACIMLGYDIDFVRDGKRGITGFEIRGVTKELLERYSKRRAEVEKGIEGFKKKFGREPSTAEIWAITRETRSAKLSEISTKEVRQLQLAQLTPEEKGSLKKVKELAMAKTVEINGRGTSGHDVPSLRRAVAHVYERKSVSQGHEVLAEALNVGMGRVDHKELERLLTTSRCLVVNLNPSADNPILSDVFATPHGLALEKWAVDFVNTTRETHPPLGKAGYQISRHLNAEQRAAVNSLLYENRDQVMALRGVAGAGKTTTLTELNRGLCAADYHAVYLAPTKAAVKVLREEGFERAETLSSFLLTAGRRNLQRSVIIVDEAGLQSNRQGVALLKLARKNQARVIFVGDTAQHVSVEAGDFLRVLEKHSKIRSVELTDIQRQSVLNYREAIKLMAHGHASEGLEKLDSMNWIKESGPEYLRNAARDYIQLSKVPTKTILLVTPTWEENHSVTAFLRDELKRSGKLGHEVKRQIWEPLEWSEAQRGDSRNYQSGMVLQFNQQYAKFKAGDSLEIASASKGKITTVHPSGKKVEIPLTKAGKFEVFRHRTIEIAEGDKLLLRENRRKDDISNGDVVTVAKMKPDGEIVTSDGKVIPADYHRLTHGYALTSYRSQGRTADHVIVATARLDKKSCYVACSRARESCSLHTPSKDILLAALSSGKTGNRKAALESLGKKVITPNRVAGVNRLKTAILPIAGHARAAVTVASRAHAWANFIKRPVSTGVWSVARMCIPGVGKIQLLITLASIAYEWSRNKSPTEIERSPQHEML